MELVGQKLNDLGDDHLLEADVGGQQRDQHEQVFGAKLAESLVDVMNKALALRCGEVVTNNQSSRLECA